MRCWALLKELLIHPKSIQKSRSNKNDQSRYSHMYLEGILGMSIQPTQHVTQARITVISIYNHNMKHDLSTFFCWTHKQMMVSAPTETFFDQSIIRNISPPIFLMVYGCVSVFDCVRVCVFCFVCVMYSQCDLAAWQVIMMSPWQPYLLKGWIFWWSTSHCQSKFS